MTLHEKKKKIIRSVITIVSMLQSRCAIDGMSAQSHWCARSPWNGRSSTPPEVEQELWKNRGWEKKKN
jgi:hypothetical protein